MAAIPLKIREAAVKAYLAGGETQQQVSARFGIKAVTLSKLVRRFRKGESLVPGKAKGRMPLLNKEEVAVLLRLAAAKPDATLRELARGFTEATGRAMRSRTLQRYLHRGGVKKVRPVLVDGPKDGKKGKNTRYGYRPSHRDPGDARRYPSSLTDVEWDLVKSLFERTGPGRPETYTRRKILDAICYVVRSGCSWRMLPKDFPQWEGVYASFRRWADDGLFERMHDMLRAQWREREGRAVEPTAAVVDSQSVRTAEKGGPKGTMAARRSRAGSAI